MTTGGSAIGIDMGTSGARAALLDATGRVLAEASAPLAPAQRRLPAAWWGAVAAALAGLGGRDALQQVAALAVDGTSGSLVAVDAAGAPLGEGSLYNEQAAPEAVRAIAAAAPAESAAHGATSPLARLLGMQDGIGIVRILHQADWLAGNLCGRYDASDENSALKTGYDPVARRWPDWLGRVGARASLLPAVLEPGTPLGPVLPAIAVRFGLPRSALVLAGTTDGCAAFLATGAGAIGEGVTSLGSTLTLKQLSSTPIFAPEYGIYSHRLGDRWLPGGASNSGGAALGCHFDPATLAALSAGLDPARPSGLDYYPLPGVGERFPIADAGLAPRLSPRPDDDAIFLHGLLEGVARIEALGYRRLADLGGPPLTSIRTVGGGARNAAWTAIRARELGVPLSPALSEQAAVGTARLALGAIARLASVAS